MEDLKIKLRKIADINKREFSNRQINDNKIEALKDKFSLLARYMNKLSDELISEANKYFKKNNIDDTDEINEFIKSQINDFIEFAKQH